MTDKEKQLLLKDLCARLPYGVIVHFHDINVDDYDRKLIGEDVDFIELDRRNCKPYLHPMSSMTEKEKEEIQNLYHQNTQEVFKDPSEIRGYRFYDISVVDWLNAYHFDYRGLIEMGLALVAPEGMYKTE